MLLLLPLLLGCGGDDATKPDDTAPTPTTTDDPRWDPSTWPREVGGDRPADVRAPGSWDGVTPLPVLVVLHGYGATGAAQDLYFQATARVETDQVIVVLPNGTVDDGGLHFWNAASACCDFYGSGVDDVGFLTSLLDEVEGAFPVDPDRIYLLGHSNGGYMAYRMACEVSDRLAAVVSLAGAAEDIRCDDAIPSVLQLHGTADDTIPYETSSWGLGAHDSVALFAERAGCGSPVENGREDYVIDVDGVETVKERWQDCPDGYNAELWTFEDGSHIPIVNTAFRDAMYAWILDQRRR